MTFGVDDYPYRTSPANRGDPWGYLTRECTSFAAWRIHNDLGLAVPRNWGSGGPWASSAAHAGVPVDHTPYVHDIICLGPGVNGAFGQGHVGVVLAVGNEVLVEDYNWSPYAYSQHILPISGSLFIHLSAAAPPPPPPGDDDMPSFVVPGKNVQVWFYVRGGIIQELWYSRGWNGPVAHPEWGSVAGELSAMVTPDGATQIVAWRAPNGNRYEVYFTGGAWNGPLQQPG